ncbi:MAG: DUF3450 domain-containing protein [Desulfococcus multivorans]|jgi:hypothetical protein|uniref:DUF3450 domain-containing protein n=1 Tax=Desulfococcus sp. TaxID=2025834 RepID=UPI002A42B70E|nr:DUF3450 domain-containing protein [Desulfococcus multivorans]
MMKWTRKRDTGRIRAERCCAILAACTVVLLGGAARIPAAGPGAAPSAGAVLETAESAVDIRRAAQQLKDRWAAEAEKLTAEADALERELARVRWRRNKTAAFTADLEQKTGDLAAAEKAALTLRDDLGPFLDEGIQRLKTFVDRDMPLHPEARDARIRHLSQLADDADADFPAKVSAFLEALSVEIEYGYLTEADAAELEVDGRVIPVRRLSVGRLGLFALAEGGRGAFRWNPGSERWEPVDDHAARIRQAIEMADRSRLAALVALPIGRPTDAAEDAVK